MRATAATGPAFSEKANEIGARLGLARVRRTCKSRDGKEPSPSQWPHDVRPVGYYLGAHAPVEAVPARKDRVNGLLEGQIQALVVRFGIEAVYDAALTLQVKEWERDQE